MQIIPGPNCLSVWQDAVRHLLTCPDDQAMGLCLDVEDAGIIDPAWLRDYDPRKIDSNGERISEVANTIFPSKTWALIQNKGGGRDRLYARYPLVYAKGKKVGPNADRNKRAWGSYFYRLIKLDPGPVNQLEAAIICINGWAKGHRGAVTFHITNHGIDAYRPMGGPCWQFGELSARDGNFLDFTVVYRSHDYFNRTLGNLIGLCRLLKFICDATGKIPGHLSCLSVYAWHSSSKSKMRALARV